MDERREKLAALQHDIWSRWMDYQFKNGRMNNDGSWTMPSQCVSCWRRQMKTVYSDLPTLEKVSDQEIADEIIDALELANSEKTN